LRLVTRFLPAALQLGFFTLLAHTPFPMHPGIHQLGYVFTGWGGRAPHGSGRGGRHYQECVTAGEPAGNLESGLAAALTGSVRLAIVSGGLACLVGAVAVTLALPALWRYDALALPVADPRQP
jgi:hypothetical protein